MPERVYMHVDGRRDHAFPLPRPSRSAALDAPDVCTDCHPQQSTKWAEEAITEWRSGRPPSMRWPDRLVDDEGARSSPDRWFEIARDGALPPIVRGSAWARYADEATQLPPIGQVRERLKEAEALEQLGLIRLTQRFSPAARLSLLRPLLDSERRAIRLAAASALMDLPPTVGRAGDRSALSRELREYRAAQEANAERAEAQVNLGVMAMHAGDLKAARQAYQRATARAPYFIPASVEWAEVERVEGRDREATQHLETALKLDPDAAWVRYALGLAYYRAGDSDRAVRELERASRDEPEAPRLALGWALALDAAGDREAAIDVLTRAIDRGVVDGEVRLAVVTLLRDAGRREEASGRAEAWLAADPDESRARALVESLRGPPN